MVTATQIANMALQHCGTKLIASNSSLSNEDSKNANEIRACYDMLRRQEMRRNVWRFSIRRVALRPIDARLSKFVTFGAFDVLETYALNDIVLATDGQFYQSLVATNLGQEPSISSTYWALFVGNYHAREYVTDWDNTITYAEGDHTVGSDDQVYVSIANANLNKDPISQPAWWSVATDEDEDDDTQADNQDYYAGELVYVGDQVYLSLQNANDEDPDGSDLWLLMTTAPTLARPNFVYPIGSGPLSDPSTRNVYTLPYGYLREAPQDPKAGSVGFLGAPGGLWYRDWDLEGRYIVTRDVGVQVFRFAADISDTLQFDPMFSAAFACSIALQVCQPLTQSGEKLQEIAGKYAKFMSEARTVNGIETGSYEPPEDAYIQDRM